MSIYYEDDLVQLLHGDALEQLRTMPDGSVDCCVTSPPYYGLRDYGEAGQYGLESSPAEYVETMRAVFAEVRRVLADDGTLWLNIGDSYQSSGGKEGVGPNARVGSTKRQEFGRTRPVSELPAKNLLGIPWRTAFALQDDGWILRNDIIWAKPNGMPESVTDRLSSKHEHLFMLSKSPRYWFDLGPIREPAVTADRTGSRGSYVHDNSHANVQWTAGTTALRSAGLTLNDAGRNPGDVWTIPTQPFSAAHFAVFPQAIPERATLAGCKPGGTVLDPFSGSGTTGLAAAKHGRKYVGIDLNADYLDLSLRTRLAQPGLDFGDGIA